MKVLCSIEESLHRPEAVRWRERMRLLEPLGDVIVILPCSMKKPYSTSKSHRTFMKVTRGFQELILTSPFGICPREMENTYPISSYDVSTTGEWSYEEKRVVGEVLREYVGDASVIAHVDGGYLEVCMEYLDDFTPTAMDARPTSPGALAKLKDALSGYDRNRPWERMLHMLRSVAVYQFGRGGEKLIPEDCRVTGRSHKKVLNSDGTEICTLMMDRGLFSLALEGGRILGDLNLKWVEIDFKLETGTLFAPGVSDADPDIIPGDEVVIMYSGDAVGVGRAVLSGEEMLRAGRGVAVRVRRRKKT
ncbi:pseudouridine synthase [Methanothermobacter sp. THM-1]|uniref:DUF5591 domain-containing protein n=1 Tax=Methanothermobacter sp. THM-1 TaxID=2606911 RepID=UPI0013672372|nr:DUF5591 domain-containing protein [Methanothermobacter sp. THM-1]QHN05780.1 pseudouridine synthase [Methanothermobacter sp. THM-1]